MPVQRTVERLIALGYAFCYDAVVRGFRPYEAMLDEIVRLIERSRAAGSTAPVRVLDVSCGVGTAAARLARAGHAVVGIDAVERLVAVARASGRAGGGRVSFHHVDVAGDPIPGRGTYDVVVSMHTLYWHPQPEAVLQACRRALKPGGHGVFLTYARPAHIVQTFREVRAAEGLAAGIRALRWLVPTAIFEALRACEHRYLSEDEFHAALARAGFEVLESRQTFLAGLSRLAWARARTDADPGVASDS